MAYSQGGLIAAADYNGFVGTSPSSTANQINTVWAVGNGNAGYGQSALSQVSGGGLVTATQWATAINTLNSIYTHQGGSGTGIGAPTAGGLVAYLSTFSGDVTTAYSNRLNAASHGTTATGSVVAASAITAANNTVYGESTVLTRTITFASGDAARYFFNAGGYFNFVITAVSNNDGTSRSADAVSTILTYTGGVSGFGATSNSGRSGSGGTVNLNNTSYGYYNLTSSYVGTHQVTSTSATYTSDYAKIYFKSNGAQGSNADTGSVITIALNYYSSHSNYASGFNDTLNVTVSTRVDIIPPETSNLTNSWGTITIA